MPDDFCFDGERRPTWDECAMDAEKPDDVPEILFLYGQLHRRRIEEALEEARKFALIDVGAGI